MHIINEIQICAESFHSNIIFFPVTDIFTYNKGELTDFTPETENYLQQ